MVMCVEICYVFSENDIGNINNIVYIFFIRAYVKKIRFMNKNNNYHSY